MYCLNPATFVPEVHDFWGYVQAFMPSLVTITQPTGGDYIDPITGTLMGAWSVAASTLRVGSDTGGYPAATGASIAWDTGTIINGHRLKGRSYLVPLANFAYDLNGTLKPAVRAEIQAGADDLVADAAANFVIWNRPKPGVAGGYSAVTSGFVPDSVAVLRSRRD